MFHFKQRNIAAWLKTAAPSPFSELLSQWLSGELKEKLTELGLTKPEIHIDFREDYKCIDIQGRREALYVDIQIEPDSFSLAMDADEPEDPVEFPLTSAGQFYDTLRARL